METVHQIRKTHKITFSQSEVQILFEKLLSLTEVVENDLSFKSLYWKICSFLIQLSQYSDLLRRHIYEKVFENELDRQFYMPFRALIKLIITNYDVNDRNYSNLSLNDLMEDHNHSDEQNLLKQTEADQKQKDVQEIREILNRNMIVNTNGEFDFLKNENFDIDHYINQLIHLDACRDDYQIPKDISKNFKSLNIHQPKLRESFIFSKDCDFLSNIIDYQNSKVNLSWLYEIFSKHESQLLEKFPLDIVCKYILHLSTKEESEDLDGDDSGSILGNIGGDSGKKMKTADDVIDMLNLEPDIVTKMMKYFINEVTILTENRKVSNNKNSKSRHSENKNTEILSNIPTINLSYENYQNKKSALLVITKLLGCHSFNDAIPEISQVIDDPEKMFLICLESACLEMNVEILSTYFLYIGENLEQIEVTANIISLLHITLIKQMPVIEAMMENKDHKMSVQYLNASFSQIKPNFYKNLHKGVHKKFHDYYVQLYQQICLALELLCDDGSEEDDSMIGDDISIDLKDYLVSEESSNNNNNDSEIKKDSAHNALRLVQLILEKREKVTIKSFDCPNTCTFEISILLAIHAALYNHIDIFDEIMKNINNYFIENIGRRFDVLTPIWSNNEEINMLPSFIDLKNYIEQRGKEELVQARIDQNQEETENLKKDDENLESIKSLEASFIADLKRKNSEIEPNLEKTKSVVPNKRPKKEIAPITFEDLDPEIFKKWDEWEAQVSKIDQQVTESATFEIKEDSMLFSDEDFSSQASEKAADSKLFPDKSRQFLQNLQRTLDQNFAYLNYSELEIMDIFDHIIEATKNGPSTEVKNEEDSEIIDVELSTKNYVIECMSYVNLLLKTIDNRLEMINAISLYYVQQNEHITDELAACYYLIIDQNNMLVGPCNSENNIIKNILKYKTEIVSNADRRMGDIIITYCQKKNWINDWVVHEGENGQKNVNDQKNSNDPENKKDENKKKEENNNNKKSQNQLTNAGLTTDIIDLRYSIHQERTIYAENLMIRYAKYYKPLFLRNFYLFGKLCLEKIKVTDFNEFRNRNLSEFWVSSINIIEAIGVKNLLQFDETAKILMEILKNLVMILGNYCINARKQCRVLTFEILSLVSQILLATSGSAFLHTSEQRENCFSSSKLLIYITMNYQVWSDVKFEFSQSALINSIISMSNILPFHILYNRNDSLNLDYIDPVELDFVTNFKETNNYARLMSRYEQSLVQLRKASESYNLDAAAGGGRMEIMHNKGILEKLLQCKTASVELVANSGNNDNNNYLSDEINSSFGLSSNAEKFRIKFNPNNLSWTQAEDFYEIFQVSGTNNNDSSNHNRLQMTNSFLTFCKQDKGAFLQSKNKRPLENFFINILKFPINTDHDLQKLFLTMINIYLKNNHGSFYYPNFKSIVIKLMLNVVTTSSIDWDLQQLYLNFMGTFLVLCSADNKVLVKRIRECLCIKGLQNRSQCDRFFSQLKLLPNLFIE